MIKSKINKILFLGDLLVSFGDFLYNNKDLLPSGYTEEWWVQEAYYAIEKDYHGNLTRAVENTNIAPKRLEDYLKKPFKVKPNAQDAVCLSHRLKIPQ